MEYRYMDSPVGQLLLAGEGSVLSLIGFEQGKGRVEPAAHWLHRPEGFERACTQLTEYFDGARQAFSLELLPSGTSFQKSVLKALEKIPFGRTATYQEIAVAIGRPKAVRAVGAANGRNPLPIVIPCHRVIGKDGSLTGFGGGLEAKRFLLDLEASTAGHSRSA